MDIRFKLTAFAMALLVTSSVALAGRQISFDHANTDRPGSDYSRTALSRADPHLCAQQCLADGKCLSFTYVRPGQQGSNAVCYLKNKSPAKVVNTCCDSGVVRSSSVPHSHVPVPHRPYLTATGRDGGPLGDAGNITACQMAGSTCPPRMLMAYDDYQGGCVCRR